ncbi:MAG: hypothetical protein IPK85_03065 [Gemmatimonadetes bacterium]|nr:hypothetical protein [Gemmatimonadota bacterium]
MRQVAAPVVLALMIYVVVIRDWIDLERVHPSDWTYLPRIAGDGYG